MKQHRSVKESMKQPTSSVTLFKPVHSSPPTVMRPGKTAKDKARKGINQ